MTTPKATARNRKPQIQRAFGLGICNLDTAIAFMGLGMGDRHLVDLDCPWHGKPVDLAHRTVTPSWMASGMVAIALVMGWW